MLTYFFFFFNDTATTEIYTLSLHDALPICLGNDLVEIPLPAELNCLVKVVPGIREIIPLIPEPPKTQVGMAGRDRKSTRLNSSHANISYAVFCLKKKKKHSLSITLAIIHHT